MCVYLTKGSYTQCQKHLLVIQLLLMHVQIKPTQQQLADVVVVLCCVNSTIDAKELFSVHQTNTTEKLSLLEDAFLFYVSRNVFQHFFGLIKETLSFYQPNDLIRKTHYCYYRFQVVIHCNGMDWKDYFHLMSIISREIIHSNIKHVKGGS